MSKVNFDKPTAMKNLGLGDHALTAMQKATGAAHAFQVVRDLPYSGADAFSYREPIAVSAQSFLSQLF